MLWVKPPEKSNETPHLQGLVIKPESVRLKQILPCCGLKSGHSTLTHIAARWCLTDIDIFWGKGFSGHFHGKSKTKQSLMVLQWKLFPNIKLKQHMQNRLFAKSSDSLDNYYVVVCLLNEQWLLYKIFHKHDHSLSGKCFK